MVERKKIGEWEFRIGELKFLDAEIIKKLEDFLTRRWLKIVLKNITQPWWSVINQGVPSPIIRVDMAPSENPKENPESSLYEVEMRPAGLGIVLFFLKTKYRNEIKKWEEVLKEFECQGFIHLKSSIQDDFLAAEILRVPYFEEIPKETRGPYWIRSEYSLEDLEKISLVPTQGDEDKNYLIELGLAKIFKMREIDWRVPFVVKPLIGSKLKGVEIYLPSEIRKRLNNPHGISTRSQVEKRVNQTPCLIQPFIPPLEERIGGIRGWTIWRLFFGWKKNEYRFLAGLWNWRPNNLRIHGNKDAIFGGLLKSGF